MSRTARAEAAKAAGERRLAGLSEEQLLAELSDVADEIDLINAQRDRLYAERRALFAEGRRREPPIGTRILGAAARVSDVLVTNSTKG